MAKPAGLLHEVSKLLPSSKRKRWTDSLPADVRAELEHVREHFLSGQMGSASRTGVAEALAAALAGRKIHVHPMTVSRWLKS